jgi:hypothetical protein
MKMQLYVYTGTGNSLWTARQLALELKEARGEDQRETCREQEVPHDYQIALPPEERRLFDEDGPVDQGNESHQSQGIVKEAIKPELVTQFLLRVLRYRCGYQEAVKSTPQHP